MEKKYKPRKINLDRPDIEYKRIGDIVYTNRGTRCYVVSDRQGKLKLKPVKEFTRFY